MVRSESPVQPLVDPLFEKKKLTISIKRDDLIHPEVMGNKWRKLKYNLVEARSGKYAGLLTFGGAFSNHIAATAAACRINEIPSVGIIRGEELTSESNHTLQKATADGMQLRFVSRKIYSIFRDNPDLLRSEYPQHFIVPEGGTNEFAVKGVSEIWLELDVQYDYMICPFGTGGTMAGLLSGRKETKVIGVSALKGGFANEELQTLLRRFQIHNPHFEIWDDYHFGGYGRASSELLGFMDSLEKKLNIPLEPVYTAKMFFGVYDKIQENYFPENSKILILHSGGLQGNAGFSVKTNK